MCGSPLPSRREKDLSHTTSIRYTYIALSPGPFPDFQYSMLKLGIGLGTWLYIYICVHTWSYVTKYGVYGVGNKSV